MAAEGEPRPATPDPARAETPSSSDTDDTFPDALPLTLTCPASISDRKRCGKLRCKKHPDLQTNALEYNDFPLLRQLHESGKIVPPLQLFFPKHKEMYFFFHKYYPIKLIITANIIPEYIHHLLHLGEPMQTFIDHVFVLGFGNFLELLDCGASSARLRERIMQMVEDETYGRLATTMLHHLDNWDRGLMKTGRRRVEEDDIEAAEAAERTLLERVAELQVDGGAAPIHVS